MSDFWYDQISHAYKNSGHCPIHTLSYKIITVHYKTLIHTLLKHLALRFFNIFKWYVYLQS